MFIKQIYTGCLSEAAYFIESEGIAAIIDPLRDVDAIYGRYFDGDFPARETVAVRGLPKNVNVEISMIAVNKTNN